MDLYRLKERCRNNGSLPLKKRRFQPIKDDFKSVVAPASGFRLTFAPTLAFPKPQLALLPLSEAAYAMPGTGDKIAALALVAAVANTATEYTMPASSSVLAPMPWADGPSLLPVASNLLVENEYFETEGINRQSHDEDDDDDDDDDEAHQENEQSSIHIPGKRIRHRPLMKPLPGGCHGKSSRHNSFCRRHPCYNGSSYCKLHYRQYVVAVGAAEKVTDDASTTSSMSMALDTTTTHPETTTSTTTKTSAVNPQHQDRRYMGSPGEARCLATTTRGRACAYVSVQGTKYCYLHADYDTNPPPRRGGCATSSSSSTKDNNIKFTSPSGGESSAFRRVGEGHPQVGTASAALEPVSRPESSRTVSEYSISSPPTVASEDSRAFLSPSPHPDNSSKASLGKKSPSRRTTATLKEKHADSPFPLLSMISTDQWSRKIVRIAVGPFKDRTGEVEKWGNGWVSVRVPGVGLHNRRSFELFLHEEGTTTGSRMKGSASFGADVQSIMKENEANVKPPSSLLPCVSRDLHSPPVQLMLAGPSGSQNEVPLVTPMPFKTRISVAHSRDMEMALPSFQSFPQHGDEAPETPRADIKPTHAQVLVTPSVQLTTRSETSIPLVDSLVLSEEISGVKKYKLDMLFGTAALERSRRSIHKPARYEDTGMLDKKRKDDGVSPSEKRQRVSSTHY